MFKDVLEGIGVLIGDIILILDVLKSAQESDIESEMIQKDRKLKRRFTKRGFYIVNIFRQR